MEKYRCKFCARIFGNGRALGGHVRSHMMKFYTKSRIHEETEDYEDEKDSSFVLQETESETESSKNLSGTVTPHFRRSKRVRKSRISETKGTDDFPSMVVEVEPTSSISETSPEDEDVAYCLMMLSKDKWIRDEEEDEDDSVEVKLKAVKKIKKFYRCESCNKVFRSYQALGGHRASHKKIKPNKNLETSTKDKKEENTDKKIHECPICYRVFSSGQALGGHKRSHFSDSVSQIVSPEAYSASTSNTIPIMNLEKNQGLSRTGGALIDLNLPAPMDDDDDDDDDDVLSFFPC